MTRLQIQIEYKSDLLEQCISRTDVAVINLSPSNEEDLIVGTGYIYPWRMVYYSHEHNGSREFTAHSLLMMKQTSERATRFQFKNENKKLE